MTCIPPPPHFLRDNGRCDMIQYSCCTLAWHGLFRSFVPASPSESLQRYARLCRRDRGIRSIVVPRSKPYCIAHEQYRGVIIIVVVRARVRGQVKFGFEPRSRNPFRRKCAARICVRRIVLRVLPCCAGIKRIRAGTRIDKKVTPHSENRWFRA